MEESAWKRLLPRLSSRRHEAAKRSLLLVALDAKTVST